MANFHSNIYHLYSKAHSVYKTKSHSQHHSLQSILTILILGSHTEHSNTKLPVCIKINNHLKIVQMAGDILQPALFYPTPEMSTEKNTDREGNIFGE